MHSIWWLKNLKRRDNSEDQEVDGKIILEWILGKQEDNIRINFRETSWKDLNWLHLARERDQWRAL